MTAVQITDVLSVVGDRQKTDGDYSLFDVIESVQSATGLLLSERTIRRMIRGLGIQKNVGGWYSQSDLVVLVGWIKRRDQYFSYREFMDIEGRQLHQKAQVIFGGSI
jgi:hypothetical protein